MIRLMMADDHAVMRSGLKQILALAPDIAIECEATNGTEVLQHVRNGNLDLLLLDMSMPGISGADLIARVRSLREDLPVLVLSMHNEPQVVVSAFKAGASGYLTKDSEPEKLLDAIRKVAGGQKYIDPLLAGKIAFDVTLPESQPPHTLLTEQELNVLLLLAKGRSINEIARQLAIDSKDVSAHKMRLMEKMDLSSTAALVCYTKQNNLLD
ncbi:MAG: response regulator transcription factor [Gallionella sp.]|nr:response regulator transcription factor [Gallionella sp.]